MYKRLPSFVLGFHGCDESVAKRIVTSPDEHLKHSTNDYDWLGHGIYFWENNPWRALEYAKLLHENPRPKGTIIRKPAVIGAVIDLGHCLNLMESDSLSILKASYDLLKLTHDSLGLSLPINKAPAGATDVLIRKLDCAVIQMAHAYNEETNQQKYDSVRGLFVEGEPLYENAGFNEKNHIQICVRKSSCIKGYFFPLNRNNNFSIN